MHDRAQVILVVTGLGGTALDEVMPARAVVSQSQPQTEVEVIEAAPLSVMASTSTNLDIPAFLRRRARQN
jgi:hypothetical protein